MFFTFYQRSITQQVRTKVSCAGRFSAHTGRLPMNPLRGRSPAIYRLHLSPGEGLPISTVYLEMAMVRYPQRKPTRQEGWMYAFYGRRSFLHVPCQCRPRPKTSDRFCQYCLVEGKVFQRELQLGHIRGNATKWRQERSCSLIGEAVRVGGAASRVRVVGP